jgi:uncharacterized protein YggE
MSENERWISVVATGEASVTPDVAIVSFAVSGSGKQLAETRDDVNKRSSSVLASLRELGVAEGDLNAPDVGIHPEYDYRKGQRLTGYRVVRQMTAKVRDLDRLGDVLDWILSAGVNEVEGAQMSAADPSAAEHAALRAAITAARAKADAVAEAGGVTIDGLARVEEEPGHGPPMPRMQMMAAGAIAEGAPTEVAAGDLTVTRQVRAWFAIE